MYANNPTLLVRVFFSLSSCGWSIIGYSFFSAALGPVPQPLPFTQDRLRLLKSPSCFGDLKEFQEFLLAQFSRGYRTTSEENFTPWQQQLGIQVAAASLRFPHAVGIIDAVVRDVCARQELYRIIFY